MRTPAGTECPYYFEDYFRGREEQACRLIERSPAAGRWEPILCSRCPVPEIVRANACEHMILEARVHPGFLGFNKHVEISAMCTKSLETVDEPQVGCSQCHPDLPPLQTPPEPP
jgi:hypothetical protein